MDLEVGGRDHIHTLRRAHEQRDVDLALGLYDEHARVRLVGHGAPPDAPEVFEGKERIAEYLRKTYLGEWSPRVGYSLNDVVEGDGRIVLNVAYVDANGPQVLAAESYVVSRGKIVEQLNIEARGGQARGEAVPREPGTSARLPIALGRTYERFLGLPPALVLAVLWVAGVALLGSIALVLYWTGWVLVQAVAGSI
jgi:hypothetical protein